MKWLLCAIAMMLSVEAGAHRFAPSLLESNGFFSPIFSMKSLTSGCSSPAMPAIRVASCFCRVGNRDGRK